MEAYPAKLFTPSCMRAPPESFNELDKLVNHRCTNFGMEKKQIAGDGMVTGYGKIDGRPVFVYAYDFTAHGGSLSGHLQIGRAHV